MRARAAGWNSDGSLRPLGIVADLVSPAVVIVFTCLAACTIARSVHGAFASASPPPAAVQPYLRFNATNAATPNIPVTLDIHEDITTIVCCSVFWYVVTCELANKGRVFLIQWALFPSLGPFSRQADCERG